MITIQKLFEDYNKYKAEHLQHNRHIEAIACDLYLSVFKRCESKYKRNKHIDFIKKWYQDSCRLGSRFGEDGQVEDAFLQRMIQEALIKFWQALDLNKTELLRESSPSIRYSGTPIKHWPNGDY